MGQLLGRQRGDRTYQEPLKPSVYFDQLFPLKFVLVKKSKQKWKPIRMVKAVLVTVEDKGEHAQS